MKVLSAAFVALILSACGPKGAHAPSEYTPFRPTGLTADQSARAARDQQAAQLIQVAALKTKISTYKRLGEQFNAGYVLNETPSFQEIMLARAQIDEMITLNHEIQISPVADPNEKMIMSQSRKGLESWKANLAE